jgi:hypothetical protein
VNVDTIALILVLLMAPPATLFPILYAFRPWYRSLIGRALMTHSVGLALLIDISLLYKAFGDDYPGRDIVRLAVYSVILVGVTGQCIALIRSRPPKP